MKKPKETGPAPGPLGECYPPRVTGRYRFDPDDPRAPSLDVWKALTERDRLDVVDSLPSDIPRATPPEGDAHRLPKERALSSLREFFRRSGRSVYLSAELPVYYPDQPMFAPDLIAVVDVPTHPRPSWVVSHEGKGLDFALEVHVSGERKKDLERNVERFARLAIPEYFVFQPLPGRLLGYRLDAAAPGEYTPVLPQGGFWRSQVLGLDLALEDRGLRFYAGTAPLLDAHELVERLSTMVDAAVTRAEDEARRAEDEARRAEDQAQRADRLADRLRALGIDPDAD